MSREQEIAELITHVRNNRVGDTCEQCGIKRVEIVRVHFSSLDLDDNADLCPDCIMPHMIPPDC